MMHPNSTAGYINPDKGMGVVATAPIPVGTIVYVYDSMEIVIGPDDPRLKISLYSHLFEHYSFSDSHGNQVMCWDHGRYMNHCCYSNTLAMPNGCNIVVRDIAAGEEITEDYALWRIVKSMPLVCQHANCRKEVGLTDNAMIADDCDVLITQAIMQWRTVPQVMLPIIDEATITELDTFLHTGTGYKSVRFMEQIH